jgi:phage tail-like protein
MDVNGTRMKLLLGRADWAACSDGDGNSLELAWDAGPATTVPDTFWDASLNELTLQPEPVEYPVSPLPDPPRLVDRRGAGADPFGNWYWIGADAASVEVFSPGDGSTATLWPAPDMTASASAASAPGGFGAAQAPPVVVPTGLSGAAVTEDLFLAIGTLDPPGLLVFDLRIGGPPMHLPWPVEVAFRPLDIATRPGGGVFVLDAVNARAWELDRHFRVVPAALPDPTEPPGGSFAPAGGPSSPPLGVAVLSPVEATPLTGAPIAIEAASDGGFLILDGGEDAPSSAVSYYAGGAQVGPAAPLQNPELSFGVHGQDMARVGTVLFVADSLGSQCYAFGLTLTPAGPQLALSPAFYPMRRYGGKGLVAAGGVANYDFGDRWLPLVAQPLERYPDTGTVVTMVLDSGLPGCLWHRLMIDARMGPGTGIQVWSVAGDDPQALEAADWQPEPDPLERANGSEFPFVDLGPYATYELLLQGGYGRFLMLKLELAGNGRATPRVRALRAWYPRFSYLHQYLPAVYGEDPDSASFLDRYLANIEGLLTAVEDQIAAVQLLFNPQTVAADALPWLAGWVALALDPLWDERRRRQFIASALQFYGVRGTIRALEIALRFALDPQVPASVFTDPEPSGPGGPRIVEAFRTRSTPGIVFGDPQDSAQPRQVTSTLRWTPDQGRDSLEQRYATYLSDCGLQPSDFPLAEPEDDSTAAWLNFCTAVLGFIPQAPDPARWSDFLQSRYSNPGAVLTAYGVSGAAPSDFSQLAPPSESTLPPDGAALLDWFQFQSVVLPMESAAHRFTVMLPWPLSVPDSSGDQSNVLTQAQIRDVASRVIELQKPAHTRFDIKFFWAAFRVGEARVGLDTQLASGSRAPELLEPALLGRDYLGASYLAGQPASDVIRRTVPGASTQSADATTQSPNAEEAP